MKGTLLLVRHGQSTWNAEHRWAGHADPPLSAAGREAAAGLAGRVEALGLTGVASSDQRRAFDTANMVAQRCGLGDVVVDARLRERRCGPWSGRTSAQIEAMYPGLLEQWRSGRLRELPGDSEGWDEFAGRVQAGLRAIVARGGRWLVVSHAGVFRVVDAALGVPAGRVGNLEGRWLGVTTSGFAHLGTFPEAPPGFS